ncbi:hypothetical protein A8C32_01390 [Flavivirga aquatica]|uniref:Sulfatase n=1 Tax=Flavivirga aquatica TaxID=1849968 RepID=A0A1E5T9T4_9FLAO|nr:sulfatase-like hydrolase/transferase [Flavivirga aquatica]OEK08143.1 hypothetical protein A8C32_01390 [Flavivirga aquatica]
MKTKLKKQLPKVLFFCACLLCFSSYAQKPNVVIILADDLGYYDIGFNRMNRSGGGAVAPASLGVIKTPNIDRIAANGVICTQAYAIHPFCGPSRAGLLTGRYPHEIGSQFNLPVRSVNCDGEHTGVSNANNAEFFSEALKKANYNTYMLGKWHLGEAERFSPQGRGFDEYYGFRGGGHQYFPAGLDYDNSGSLRDNPEDITSSNAIYRNAIKNKREGSVNEYLTYVEKNGVGLPNESRYITDAISDEAIEFIRKGKRSNNPFLAYVAYNAPHTPLQASVAQKNSFLSRHPGFRNALRNSSDILKAKSVRDASPANRNTEINKLIENRITYATMVDVMDQGVGRILDEINSNRDGGSAKNNTIVIFLSDNGGKRFSAGGVNYPLDEGKGSLNEGGFRVPFAISWPRGNIRGGRKYNFPISALDIYPTLLAAAGRPIPARLDGENALPGLRQNKLIARDQPLYVLRHFNGFSNLSIYDNTPGNHNKKLVRKSRADWQYYDLSTDISESTNLRSSRRTEATQLINRLVPQVQELAKQHKQPQFFDNCRGIQDKWDNQNMPRYQDASRTNAQGNAIKDNTFSLGKISTAKNDTKFSATDELLANGNKLTISPVPAYNFINFNFTKEVAELDIEIMALDGKVVKQAVFSDVKASKIDLSGLSNGLYIIKTSVDGNPQKPRKIVKK